MNLNESISSLFINLQSLYRKNIKIKNLTFPQTLILYVIPEKGEQLSRLSLKIGVDISTMSRAIKGLEKKGFWLLDFEINDGQKKTIISEQIEIFERNRTIGNSDFSYAFLIIQFIFFGGIIYLFISSRIRKKKLNI